MVWIVPPRRQLLTQNRYASTSSKVRPVAAVVLHFTVGTRAESSARYMANRCTDKAGNVIKAGAAAHLVIGHDGDVWQLAPLSSRCWHAGSRSSRWRGMQPNPRTIGIELSNLGPLFRRGDGWTDYYGRAYRGPVAPNTIPIVPPGDARDSDLIRSWCRGQSIDVPESTDGEPWQALAWEPYPAAQLEALAWALELLAERFPIIRQADEQVGEHSRICGHQDVDPARKLDPGPAFPLAAIRATIQTGGAQ